MALIENLRHGVHELADGFMYLLSKAAVCCKVGQLATVMSQQQGIPGLFDFMLSGCLP